MIEIQNQRAAEALPRYAIGIEQMKTAAGPRAPRTLARAVRRSGACRRRPRRRATS